MKKYRCHSLVYFETGNDVLSAIEREKQLKGLLREKKLALINRMNPRWKDLSIFPDNATDPSLRSG